MRKIINEKYIPRVNNTKKRAEKAFKKIKEIFSVFFFASPAIPVVRERQRSGDIKNICVSVLNIKEK